MKKTKTTQNIIFFIISILSIPFSYAQDTTLIEIDRLQTEDIIEGRASTDVKIVSASRYSQSVSDLPITVYVVTKEEIQKNGYNSLVDVMKNVPGVRVSQPGGGYEGEMFLMRGLIGNSYAKILINNIPIQPSVIGGIPINEQLPIAQAERIEIIFGPAAAIYGADALSGVINIITQKPEDFNFSQANITTGEYGYRNANFITGGKAGKNNKIVEFSVYGSFSQRNDMNIIHEGNPNLFNPLFYTALGDPEFARLYETNPEQAFEFFKVLSPLYEGDASTPKFAEFREQSFLLGTTISFKGLTFDFQEMYRESPSNLGRSPEIFSYASPNYFIGQSFRRVAMSYNLNLNNSFLTINSSYLRYRMDTQSNAGSNYQTSVGSTGYKFEASDDIFTEILFGFPLNEKISVTTGMSAQISSTYALTNDLDEPFNANDYRPFSLNRPTPHPLYGDFGHNPVNFQNYGAFAQLYYQTGRFSAVGGIRADFSSLFGGIVFPRLSMLYKFNEKSSIRLTSGAGVKTPSISSIYSSLALPNFTVVNGVSVMDTDSVNYQQVPNTELRPETFTSFEIGLRKKFSKNIDLDIAIYLNETNQLITSTIVPIDLNEYPNAAFSSGGNNIFNVPSARVNINDENTQGRLIGIQSNLRLKNIWERINLDVDLFYNYTIGEEILPEGRGRIDNYRMVPQHFLQCNLSATPLKNWYVSIRNIWSSNFLRRFVPIAEVANSPITQIKGYYNMDFHTRYQINEDFSLFLDIQNVFNSEYAGIGPTGLDVDLLYNPQYLRNIQGGISFRLN